MEKNKSKKRGIILITLVVIAITFFAFTYGKWEWNTFFYGKEFRPVIEAYQNASNTLISPGIKALKVFSYADEQAQVFLRDGEGNTWLINFKKGEENNWLIRYDGHDHYDILYSTRGGSADKKFYWY